MNEKSPTNRAVSSHPPEVSPVSHTSEKSEALRGGSAGSYVQRQGDLITGIDVGAEQLTAVTCRVHQDGTLEIVQETRVDKAVPLSENRAWPEGKVEGS